MKKRCNTCKFMDGDYRNPHCTVAGKPDKEKQYPGCNYDDTCPNWKIRFTAEERIAGLERQVDEGESYQKKKNEAFGREVENLKRKVFDLEHPTGWWRF